MYKLLFFVWFLIQYSWSVPIKLQNETHIHCIEIDDNNINNLPLFVSPPIEKIATPKNVLEKLEWSHNDWDSMKGSNLAPVVDKRWNDFSIKKTNNLSFNLTTTPISLSVYSPVELEIFITDGRKILLYNFIKMTTQRKWNHLTVILKDSYVFIIENNRIIRKEYLQNTQKIIFRSRSKTYWKEHKHDFLWSNSITSNKPSTILKIPSHHTSCLLLYTSLCKECFLEITNNNKIINISSTNQEQEEEEEITKSWQTTKVYLNPNNESIIEFRRGKKSNSPDKYWAIDFDFCDSTNMISFKTDNSNKYTCNSLDEDKRYDNLNENEIFNQLYKTFKTTFNCRNLFGSEIQHCDRYEICFKSKCENAWQSQPSLTYNYNEYNRNSSKSRYSSSMWWFILLISVVVFK